MDAATRDFVRRRAAGRCEYCLLRQEHCDLAHHVEHIVAKQHGGSDDASNLALACHRCNLRKGPNLTAIDPVTREVVPLFHPRSNDWAEHFIVEGERIIGTTAVGRATVQLLAMNDARRLELRAQILSSGEQP
ncbi:MAG: HNH endonuclease [Bryobacteraceae bacterium]|jgi:5-methylcytosine-specific restriction endonuclease McrA